ncbi:MAG: TIGR00730 family Rossman fold protein, partial [Sulfurimonadaceae bacterium]
MRKGSKNHNGFHKQFTIPKPPEVTKREERLPSERPKPVQEDPGTPQRMHELLQNPNYRPADKDPDFLREDAARGLRLQADYLKTELLLQKYGIGHTIAVFGGTRIAEEAEAHRNLLETQAALERDPENEALRHKCSVCEKILHKSHFYTISREFGRIVGRSGEGPNDCRVTIMTGGGPGIMEAANRGAFDVGAKSIGLNITLPREQFPNPYITPELCFQLHYFSMRKLHFFNRAKALVAFPGGFGTLDELVEALTLVQTRKIAPMPIVLVGQEFWEGMIDFGYLLDEGVIDPEDIKLFWYAESAEEIWDGILLWHRENGTP